MTASWVTREGRWYLYGLLLCVVLVGTFFAGFQSGVHEILDEERTGLTPCPQKGVKP
jgi:hypothetical protein